MTLTDLGILAGLALVDSTSVGTLVIPLWLLSRSNIHPPALLTYLGILNGFYWLVGMVVLIGGEKISQMTSQFNLPLPVIWGQLVVGAGLVLWGLWIDEQPAANGLSPRMQRWQEKTLNAAQSPSLLAGLALIAGLFELATMLPYLAALSRLSQMNLAIGSQATWLIAYVLLMTLPALSLLALRILLQDRIASFLLKLETWLTRQSKAILSTAFMVVGALLALPAAQSLGLLKF